MRETPGVVRPQNARIRRWTVLLAGAAIALCALPAAADDGDELRSVLSESVITTASTSAEKASTAPATSVTLTSEDLRMYGIRSLDEAINFLALGVVTSDPLRTPDIGARGVLLPDDNGKHFLLLVNGHALNDPLYGAARFDHGAGVPIEIIDHIEVIVGPGSVLYGSNAMMGVINVITKDAADYRGGHLMSEYEPGRSARAGAGAGMTFSVFEQPSELTAQAGYFYRFGPNLDFDLQAPLQNSGTGEPVSYGPNAPVKGRWGGTVTEAYYTKAASAVLRFRTGDLEINLLGSAYERGFPYSTANRRVDFDDAEGFELDRALRLDVKHRATLSSMVQLTSRAYADSFDYQRRLNEDGELAVACLGANVRTCQRYVVGISRWGGAELALSLNWLEDLSFVTLFGLDARMRWVEAKEDTIDKQTGSLIAPSTGLIDDSGPLISPYVQQTWSPARSVDVNVGARLDADARFDPNLSPRAAIALTPLPGTTLKSVYSQAFRAPTWSETNASERTQVRSPDIEPEIVRSLEGSIEQRFAGQRLLFGLFRTWWSNLIEPHVLTLGELQDLQRRGEVPFVAVGYTRYQNISDLENFGWNGGWHGALGDGRFRYGVNATAAYTRRRSESGSRPLPVAPQLFGNSHVAYVLEGGLPTPAVAVHYVGERPIDRADDGDFSAVPYTSSSIQLRGTLSGAVPGILGLEYRLSAAYTSAREGPYIAGATAIDRLISVQGPTSGPPGHNPIDRFNVFFGLEYAFDSEATGAGE